ncbi:hypothetical protein BH09ACT9_BH09ACT9_22280 [soil metagenome]
MHLGHTDFLGDLCLRQISEESEHQHRPLSLGQLVEKRTQRLVILDVLECCVVVTECLHEREIVGVIGRGTVDRDRLIRVAGDQGLGNFFAFDPQRLGQLVDGRRVPELL